jgi:2-polyprenyl-6-methoxyphenol hydroxylase-like FAD-dependent oxidoreductase
MAGLFAARALSEAYREVVIVDRDELIGVTGTRRAVPQGGHIHALLARGQQILEEFFPGFTDELVEQGAPAGDFSKHLRWYFNGRKLKQVETGLICVGAGRPLLEGHLRTRVSALPGVSFRQRTDILGLEVSGSRVVGARVQSQEEGASAELLRADLVVDATGRGSRTARWLEELGYARVEEERVKMDLTYTTGDFKLDRATDELGDDIAIIPVASPELPRGAIYARLTDRHSVSLTGIAGERPPTDREGFMAYVKSLPVPEIYQAVCDADFIGEPVTFHFPQSVRRRFERMERFPDGLLLIGDAFCIFNPVYGQGMTVAAMEAHVLLKHLRKGVAPEPRAYLRDIARTINAPWDMSTGADLGFPTTVGKRTLKVRMGNVFIPKLQAAATVDGELANAFMHAAGLVAPPESLMKPGVILRTLRSAGAAAPAPPPAPAGAAARSDVSGG